MSRVFGALFHFDCRLHILSLRQSLLRLWTHLAFSSFPFTESREPKRSRRIVASEIHSFACVHVKLLFEHVKPTFHRVSMYDEEKKFVNITLCISIERPKIAIVGGRSPSSRRNFFGTTTCATFFPHSCQICRSMLATCYAVHRRFVLFDEKGTLISWRIILGRQGKSLLQKRTGRNSLNSHGFFTDLAIWLSRLSSKTLGSFIYGFRKKTNNLVSCTVSFRIGCRSGSKSKRALVISPKTPFFLWRYFQDQSFSIGSLTCPKDHQFLTTESIQTGGGGRRLFVFILHLRVV